MNDPNDGATEREGREECLEALYRLELSSKSATWQTLRGNRDLASIDIPATILGLVSSGDIRLNGDAITLTAPGRLTGRRIYRRHELAERFFRLLGLKRETAHQEACRVEHIVSLPDECSCHGEEHDELSDVVELLGRGAVPLTRCQPGVTYQVGMVFSGRHARRKLEDLGVSRGAEIALASRGPGGPVEVLVRGSRLAIGRGIASKVLVIPRLPSPLATENSAGRRSHHGRFPRRHGRPR